jgi:hypothetical protein
MGWVFTPMGIFGGWSHIIANTQILQKKTIYTTKTLPLLEPQANHEKRWFAKRMHQVDGPLDLRKNGRKLDRS